uniref:CCHC-type domain-containing protein n=1 Tax=Solanum tuberosum TaxID=4113 RepID=M1DIQ6_SOLTU
MTRRLALLLSHRRFVLAFSIFTFWTIRRSLSSPSHLLSSPRRSLHPTLHVLFHPPEGSEAGVGEGVSAGNESTLTYGEVSIGVALLLSISSRVNSASICRISVEKDRVTSISLAGSRGTPAYRHNSMIKTGNGRDVSVCLALTATSCKNQQSQDMTTPRANIERNEQDIVKQEVPLQAPPQAPIDTIGENVTNAEIRCDKRHSGKCLAGSNTCFGCGESGHKIRHCPMAAKSEGDSRRRSQPYPSSGPSVSSSSAPKQTRSFALQSRSEQECHPNVTSGGLNVKVQLPKDQPRVLEEDPKSSPQNCLKRATYGWHLRPVGGPIPRGWLSSVKGHDEELQTMNNGPAVCPVDPPTVRGARLWVMLVGCLNSAKARDF